MIDRRKMFALLGAAGAAALFPTVGNAAPQQQEAHHATAGEEPQANPNDALARLKKGNLRFVSGQSQHSHESASLRHQFVSGKHKFAIVLGCGDSRVPVELIFDQGFGDFLVIRVAGNVITDDVLGSIEYARIHLNSQLLVILGHEGCGAVTAALEAWKHASSDPHGIHTIVKLPDPAVGNIDPGLPVSQQVHRAVESNVRWAQEELKNLPETRNLPLSMAGAVYDLEGRFAGSVRRSRNFLTCNVHGKL
jgi:carbonic anhydrase